MSLASDFALSVRHAEPAAFWFGSVIAVLLAVAATWGAFVFINRKRVIEDLPTALIRSAPQGYVELQGYAELMDGDPIYATLSNRLSVWYAYKIEKREQGQRNGRRESRWVTIESATSDDLFYLVDPTGRCAVDPDGAAVTPTHLNVWYGSSRIAGRYHPSDGEWWARSLGAMSKPYRYTERRIEPGDPIYALGNFTTHGRGSARFDKNGAIGDRLRVWKRDHAFMLQHFDANGDGQIDMQEWQAARAEAERAVIGEHEQGGAPPPIDVLGQTRDRRRPFVIHAGSEAEIIRRCQRYAAGLLLVGIPLAALALWSFAIRFATA